MLMVGVPSGEDYEAIEAVLRPLSCCRLSLLTFVSFLNLYATQDHMEITVAVLREVNHVSWIAALRCTVTVVLVHRACRTFSGHSRSSDSSRHFSLDISPFTSCKRFCEFRLHTCP